jgi:uncharacterized protein YjbI with pentapeptide repeats
VDFQHADLTEASFENADLWRSNLMYTILEDTRFNGAVTDGVYWTGSSSK